MEKSGAAPSQAGQFLADDPLPTSGPRTLLRVEYRGPPSRPHAPAPMSPWAQPALSPGGKSTGIDRKWFPWAAG